ncbi:hypothetical protein JCM12178A_20630 [Salidesulfovibrio brasiliensis]
MLDRVSATAVEVAGTAVLARGPAHALGHLGPVRGVVGLSIALEELALLLVGIVRIRNVLCGISCSGRELLVRTGLLMTDQTVDLLLRGEVEILVLPAVTGVT